jgi:hypothetical protein
MLFLFISLFTWFQSLWLPDAPPPQSDKCTTTFVVTSCSEKPVPGARIQLITGYYDKITGKTGKDGKVVLESCLLNYRIYGEPKLYLSTGDSAYVYKVFPNGHIIRITEKQRIERMSSYLKYSYFGGSDVVEVSDSILLYKIDAPTAIIKMNMRYKTNRHSKMGMRKERSKMKLGEKAVKNFVTGECVWQDGGLVCPVNICSK